MKNFLRICDFYGSEFHWYFDYKPKYYTYYGGIFSILSIILYILIFILFGLDDFKRTNPISNISNIPPLVHKTIQFGKEKLYLPWRIMDYGEKFIDFNGILFPRIYYFTNKYNKKTGLMETFYEVLNYTLCNNTSMRFLGKDYLIDLPLDKLYCIDMENLNMGGSWNEDFVNYIRLDLNLCKDGLNYDESNIKCTPRKYLNSLYGEDNNWFIELLYPSVQYQPYNKTMPFLVIYTSYYYGLSINSNKIDRIYFQENIFEDEKGWILDKITNITYWGVSSIKSDFYTIGERDIFRYGSTSRIYSFKLYIDFSTNLYSRKYKKLFEIISELFPIIKCVSSFFSLISLMLKKLEIAKKLNEYIIGNEIKTFKKNESEKIYFNNNSINKIKFSYNLSPIELNNNINCKNNATKFALNSSNILCLNNNVSNAENIGSSKKNKMEKNKKGQLSIVENLKMRYSKTLNISIINADIFEKFGRKKPNFPLYNYFFATFLNKIYSKHKNKYLCISEQFDLSYSLFTHIIDITFYISLYKQLESLKTLILNDNSPFSELNKIKGNVKDNNQLLKGKYSYENL